MTLRNASVFLILLCLVSAADGRAFRLWSYEELLKASDLVVIIEPIATEDAKDIYPGEVYGQTLTDFQGLNTTFRIHAILKGSASTDKPLIVLHFSYSRDVRTLPNGARFAYFVPGPLEFKKQILKDQKEVGGITVFQETPAWLAFLKKRDDGRYEPVTDPYDAVDSFRELHQSSFFVPSK